MLASSILLFSIFWVIIHGRVGLKLGTTNGIIGGFLFFLFLLPSGFLIALGGGIVVGCCLAY
jgi:hypothetical protein